jgi:hypothetical protein
MHVQARTRPGWARARMQPVHLAILARGHPTEGHPKSLRTLTYMHACRPLGPCGAACGLRDVTHPRAPKAARAAPVKSRHVHVQGQTSRNAIKLSDTKSTQPKPPCNAPGQRSAPTGQHTCSHRIVHTCAHYQALPCGIEDRAKTRLDRAALVTCPTRSLITSRPVVPGRRTRDGIS